MSVRNYSRVNSARCQVTINMRLFAAISFLFLLPLESCSAPANAQHAAKAETPLTHIQITGATIRQNVQRMGINLGEQTFYDSGQILRNLVARNPGFEGAEFRTILHCVRASTTSCTDETPNSLWPADFWAHADCVWMTGPSANQPCTVVASTKATASAGTTLTLAQTHRDLTGDYLSVHIAKPGDPTAGWWPESSNGALFLAETKDLAPNTDGHQALRIEAIAKNQTASVSSYFDSTEGRTFLRMNGRYRLTFRAKGIAGRNLLKVSVTRLASPAESFFARDLTLPSEWKTHTFEFIASEPPSAIGSVRLRFETSASNVLLDDISLERINPDPTNTTLFRDEVISALRELRPGVLRYMGSSTELGSTMANLLAAPNARQRSAYSPWQPHPEEAPIGIPEFIALCHAVDADPWLTLPAATSPDEMRRLIEYLKSTGKPFHTIHLELGNEVWNSIYRGATIEDPLAYASRAKEVFTAARNTPGFEPSKFDLIIGGQAVASDRNQDILDHSAAFDTLAIAPYLMHWVNDESSTNAVFASLFAEPEMMSSTGIVSQNAGAAAHATHRANLAVYEVNLHTTEGRISQPALDHLTSSAGAGVSVAAHMLLMLRDAGVTTQALFSITGFQNKRTDGKSINLWGTVIDMGATNRRRPQFLAVELINRAIYSKMLATQQTGINPTWQQLSGNDDVAIPAAHELQSFAFAEGRNRSIILINLSRSSPNDVDFTGNASPSGNVQVSQLTSANITDTNEESENVRIIVRQASAFNPSARFTLPPYSITVLNWQSPN